MYICMHVCMYICNVCMYVCMYVRMYVCVYVCMHACMYVCKHVYIGFKTSFYVVRHLDSIASYLPTGLHLGFLRSWPSLYLSTNFSSVFLVLSLNSNCNAENFRTLQNSVLAELRPVYQRTVIFTHKHW